LEAEKRAALALDAMHRAHRMIGMATEAADPVQQRRLHVQAAKLLRGAANQLDDNGRLEE
jgi:hypothetical protein